MKANGGVTSTYGPSSHRTIFLIRLNRARSVLTRLSLVEGVCDVWAMKSIFGFHRKLIISTEKKNGGRHPKASHGSVFHREANGQRLLSPLRMFIWFHHNCQSVIISYVPSSVAGQRFGAFAVLGMDIPQTDNNVGPCANEYLRSVRSVVTPILVCTAAFVAPNLSVEQIGVSPFEKKEAAIHSKRSIH